MQRTILGILALISLMVGGFLFFSPSENDSLLGLGGMMIRVGILMGLIWLSWPDLAKIPFWLVGLVLGISIAVVWIGGWKALFVAIPVVLAFWLFAPRLRMRPPA